MSFDVLETILPWDNHMVELRMTGASLRAVIAHGVASIADGGGALFQTSGLWSQSASGPFFVVKQTSAAQGRCLDQSS